MSRRRREFVTLLREVHDESRDTVERGKILDRTGRLETQGRVLHRETDRLARGAQLSPTSSARTTRRNSLPVSL